MNINPYQQLFVKYAGAATPNEGYPESGASSEVDTSDTDAGGGTSGDEVSADFTPPDVGDTADASAAVEVPVRQFPKRDMLKDTMKGVGYGGLAGILLGGLAGTGVGGMKYLLSSPEERAKRTLLSLIGRNAAIGAAGGGVLGGVTGGVLTNRASSLINKYVDDVNKGLKDHKEVVDMLMNDKKRNGFLEMIATMLAGRPRK